MLLGPACDEKGFNAVPAVGVLIPDSDDVIIPDLAIYRAGRPVIRDIYVPVADVILACEIASHSSRQRDRFAKPQLLAANQVPFYLLIDPFPRPVHLTLYGLDGDSFVELARVEAGTPLHLPAPFDLDLDTSRLG